MSKPSNWYLMDAEQRRQWEALDRERQDLEYERDQARNQAEQDDRRHKRAVADYRDELEAVRMERADLQEAAEEAGEELDYVNRYLRERGYMDDYKAWRKEVE